MPSRLQRFDCLCRGGPAFGGRGPGSDVRAGGSGRLDQTRCVPCAM